jgi:energy-coupling factor transporter ATP-binding protein EcfA2
MHKLYEESLKAAGALSPGLPKVFEAAEKVVAREIEPKMRALMTANELITFAGHLRKNINWQGSSIPVNSIGILIGASGSGKGRSLKAIQAILAPAISLIEKSRIAQAKLTAVESAEIAGKKPDKWRDFYSEPRDLVVAISSLEGWIKHLNGLEAGKLGGGTLYVDEIASELASSKYLMDLLTSLSILYDGGSLPVKALKSDENQSKAVRNLPVSALLFGSPHGLIYNEAVKKKFVDEFSSKLARRALVGFTPTELPDISFDSIEASRAYSRDEESRITKAVTELTPWFTALVGSTTHTQLEVSDEVGDLFSDYLHYNKGIASEKSMLHPLAKIHRQHRQWVAMKIAGALAILEGDITIEKHHFVEAINFVEMFVDDLELLEIELSKEPYELFADYIASIAENGYANMSIHKLRKMGFVKGTGAAQGKMLELIDMAKSYDDHNRYEYAEGYIHFYEEATRQSNERDELA